MMFIIFLSDFNCDMKKPNKPPMDSQDLCDLLDIYRHSLMLLWFTDSMNVTEKVTIHRPNVLTLLSSVFTRGDLNTATRGPLI